MSETKSARQSRITDTESQTCPRRISEFGPWKREEGLDSWQRGRWAATQEEADAEVAEFMAANPNGGIGNVHWNYGGEQPRTCSFCGGAHPDDVVALVKAGWEVGWTDKSYKRYLEPPGYRASVERFLSSRLTGEPKGEQVRSPVPPVKVYVQHFSEAQIDAVNVALRERRA